MPESIVDSFAKIKALDSHNMLGSLELLAEQIKEVGESAKKVSVPKNFSSAKQVVVLGMGGSALGAHVIRSLYGSSLKVPLEIVNGYHIPGYVNKETLVVVSSYSGTTEEPVAAMREALKRTKKIFVICSGGTLESLAKKYKLPALVFTTHNNPCGSPRMGLGYSIVGQALLLAQAGIISFSKKDAAAVIKTVAKYQAMFGVGAKLSNNKAKQVAVLTADKSVWYIASEHLVGNAHVAANQTNENAKRFGGYFVIPELNHHLMEGMLEPSINKQHILFVFLESLAYDARIEKRFAITKKVLAHNKIQYVSYACQETKPLMQVFEVLVLGSYISYYSALLAGIDPTAIPYVDFFKDELKKS